MGAARQDTTTLSRASAGQVLVACLTEHAAELRRQDVGLRADDPRSVHQLRIAARRLRSALTTYGPLLAPSSADGTRDDLRWMGRTLAAARDAQVLREHLHAMLAAEPPELVLGPVMSRIDDELRTAERTGREQALQALDSERYLRLLDALDELVGSTPLVDDAGLPADRVLPRLLRRDTRRLRRAVKAIDRSEGPVQRDAALHEARKKAKRVRYAAESAVPVLGKPAEALAASAKTMQVALGEHQDAVVARHRLREYAVHAYGHGENGFTFGRLHALEQARADDAERTFTAAWKGRPGKTVRRWARG